MQEKKKKYKPLNVRLISFREDVLTTSGEIIGDFNPNWLQSEE